MINLIFGSYATYGEIILIELLLSIYPIRVLGSKNKFHSFAGEDFIVWFIIFYIVILFAILCGGLYKMIKKK